MTLRTTGPIFGLMNLSDQWPFGLLAIRPYGTIFGPMALRTTDLSDFWPFGPVHDFRTNEPSNQRPFGISSCPPLATPVECWVTGGCKAEMTDDGLHPIPTPLELINRTSNIKWGWYRKTTSQLIIFDNWTICDTNEIGGYTMARDTVHHNMSWGK